MKIENNFLVLTVDGTEMTIALAAVATDATVKVWRVPTEYRPNGVFIAVTARGGIEEIPACDMASAVFIGSLPLAANDVARLEAAKEVKRLEINEACNTAVTQLAVSYPEREIQSWPQQVKEAEALVANPQAAAPLLTAIADARGLHVEDLASRVLAKMAAYAAASGTLIGRRQVAEDRIDLAASSEDVAAIVW